MEEALRAASRAPTRRDEVDVAELLLGLWRRRAWIAAGTAASLCLGVAYALLAEPVYHAQATIALKERDKGAGSGAGGVLAQLGGLGGAVASQLGVGSANLDKLEIILKGHELAERVVTRHGLLPILFRDRWDTARKAWKVPDSGKVPTVLMGATVLRKEHLTVVPELKKGMLKVGVHAHDPGLAKAWVEIYLEELNEKIRKDVIEDAELNRAYLERQLGNTSDPVLMEKIQNMIAYELEKMMLVSSKSFETLERPIRPMVKVKPKRARIAVMSLLGGLAASIAAVLAAGWLSGMRSRLG